MTIISYAQNYEDVILFRALNGIENGFYIDVGAMDPTIDSVTKLFYDRGWRGINIEPVVKWFNKLQKERNEDKNFNVAITEKKGASTLYCFSDTGISTLNKELADSHVANHGFQHQEVNVPTITLNELLDNIPLQSDIHFLKIDVEGNEKEVLSSISFTKYRPWIILVEATQAGTRIENYSSWEQILLQNNYSFVYFDGINRFYLANEKEEIASVFALPINVYDDFMLNREWNIRQELAVIQDELIITRQELTATLNELSITKQDLAETKKSYSMDMKNEGDLAVELEKVYSSKSWRLTKPLRKMASFYKSLLRK
jgi:FkbM family methyltransferase